MAAAAREASEWFVTIQSNQDLPPERLQDWLRWLEASPDNKQAFEQIARIWHGTNASVVAQPADEGEEDYDDSMSVSEWKARKQRPVVSTHRRHYFAAAAAVLLSVLALLTLWARFFPGSYSEGTFATRTGEHRELQLADGSHITLGGASRLTVNFSSTARDIRLDAGEAFFSVAKDPTRTFNVHAMQGVISAVGTAFNVQAIENRVTVTVTEGTVRVVGNDAGSAATEGMVTASAHSKNVTRGQELTYRAVPLLAPIAEEELKQVDPAASVRWREGWLMYHNEPLRYVLADVGRYTDLKIEVSSDAAAMQFSGAIYKDRIAEWIVALPEVAAVAVERQGDHLTIRSRTTASTLQQ
ncbi:FecR family protein [Steroidobacter sp.]|uniref:FecR family protein n=1 Tax=Steroidobacter sp. TaxID=1978227 RepID=UPI001A5566D8|nr:FecR domain-containing protein [Steroidobacter sp.]MBL8267902.1 FecR domain-containing protein [Steroidobacter sp.]